MMTSNVRLIQGLQELSPSIKLIICDLWGVIHNGVQAHPSAINAIEQARAGGIKTVFLSNAPRPRGHVRAMLLDMGVPVIITDNIVTSGGLARDAVRERYSGVNLYHLGPDTDHNTIEGLPVTLVSDPDQADVILATGLALKEVELHRDLLANACTRAVPFLCANPDRVVHVGEKLFLCAGAVADLYAEMGGKVEWFGKPMAEALHSCISECGLDNTCISPDEIIMIGDSLQTDIAGAHAAGYKSLFVAGGIHRDEWPLVTEKISNNVLSAQNFHGVFGAQKPMPCFITETLVW